MATKIVIWGGQILTEDFINKRIDEQIKYLFEIADLESNGVIIFSRWKELRDSARGVLMTFKELQNKLKLV